MVATLDVLVVGDAVDFAVVDTAGADAVVVVLLVVSGSASGGEVVCVRSTVMGGLVGSLSFAVSLAARLRSVFFCPFLYQGAPKRSYTARQILVSWRKRRIFSF